MYRLCSTVTLPLTSADIRHDPNADEPSVVNAAGSRQPGRSPMMPSQVATRRLGLCEAFKWGSGTWPGKAEVGYPGLVIVPAVTQTWCECQNQPVSVVLTCYDHSSACRCFTSTITGSCPSLLPKDSRAAAYEGPCNLQGVLCRWKFSGCGKSLKLAVHPHPLLPLSNGISSES